MERIKSPKEMSNGELVDAFGIAMYHAGFTSKTNRLKREILRRMKDDRGGK